MTCMDTETEDLAGARVFGCVLPKCDWTYVDRAPLLGDWLAASTSLEERAAAVERAIQVHILGDHRISEWLTRIRDLERALTCAQEALSASRSLDRCYDWLATWAPERPVFNGSLEGLRAIVMDLAYVKAKELSE